MSNKHGASQLLTWEDPERKTPYAVIVGSDFRTAERAIEAWEHYKEQLGTVSKIYISQNGIRGIPVAEDYLATFVALGSTGAALALSGLGCGFNGDRAQGSARILRELGISEAVVSLVFQCRSLRFVRFKGAWLVEVDPGEI